MADAYHQTARHLRYVCLFIFYIFFIFLYLYFKCLYFATITFFYSAYHYYVHYKESLCLKLSALNDRGIFPSHRKMRIHTHQTLSSHLSRRINVMNERERKRRKKRASLWRRELYRLVSSSFLSTAITRRISTRPMVEWREEVRSYIICTSD